MSRWNMAQEKNRFGCMKCHTIPELLLQTHYIPFTRRKRPGTYLDGRASKGRRSVVRGRFVP